MDLAPGRTERIKRGSHEVRTEEYVPISDGGSVYGPFGAWRSPGVCTAILCATRPTGRCPGRESFAGSDRLARSTDCSLPGPIAGSSPGCIDISFRNRTAAAVAESE